MSQRPEKSPDQAARDRAERDSLLETVESFVVAFILAFVFRAYVVEAFVIPTGSMAPRLNGEHHACVCPTCGYAYGVGIDSRAAPPSLGCPMCGSRVPVPRVPNAGDRILVLKYMYDLFEPQRWDVVVFKYPNDPSQNYIKRLAGLPGEKIEIIGGDLYVNDRIAPPKPDRAQESLWMPVGDTRYEGPGHRGRWHPSASSGAAPPVTEWPVTLSPSDGDSVWLEYHHIDAHGQPDAIRDVYAYNMLAARNDGQNVVTDLRLRADVTLEPGAVVEVVLTARDDEFRFVFPASGSGQKTRILRNGQLVAEGPADVAPSGREVCLEAANVDHGLVLKVDGRRVMDLNGDGRLNEQDNVAYDVPSRSRAWDRSEAEASGVRIGVRGGAAAVARLRVDRDVYYTDDRGTAAPRHGRGVESDPCRLAADEFFVLGDNSPNSQDSRRWDHEPVVSRDHLIGKAFFVYWPSAEPAPGLPVRIVPTVSKFRFIR